MLASLVREVIRRVGLSGSLRTAGGLGVMGITAEEARAVCPNGFPVGLAGAEARLAEPRESIRIGIRVLQAYLERFPDPQLAVEAFLLNRGRGDMIDLPIDVNT